MKNKILSSFVMLVMVLQFFAVSISAEDNILSIYKNNPEVNQPFKAENMFPGDYITKKYQIDVSHTGEIIIYFTVDVRDNPEYEKLAEVLECKVVMPDEGRVLYEGPMKDVPDISYTMNAGSSSVTRRLNYEIAVSLDTSVGNEYQKKDLVADFKWWAYTANEGEGGDQGGNNQGGGIQGGGGIGGIPGRVDRDEPTDTPGTGGEGVEPSDKPADDDREPDSKDEWINPDEDTTDSGKKEDRPTGELTAPKTGDTFAPLVWILFIIAGAVIIFFAAKKRKKEDKVQTADGLAKKLRIYLAVIVALMVCLCITTFALVMSMVSVEENIFRTGEVKIEIYNDKKEPNPIIKDDEFMLEPGMTIVKDFYVKNNSTDPKGIWYKIYFDHVEGGLASVLNVKITDKEKNVVLYNDKAINLTKEKTLASEFVPGDDEWRELSLEFHYPEESGNDTQNAYLTFEVVAEASQKSNNSNKEFT